MRKQVAAVVLLMLGAGALSAQTFNSVPLRSKWVSNRDVVFTYDGTYEDEDCFRVTAPKWKVTRGVKAPEKFADFPIQPEGAVNLTYSPDSTMLAFTREGDLYTVDIATGKEQRLTFDGSETVYNGYASWVYYEEILGRPTRYRAFWWSPDSHKIAFYHFDDTQVPMFPIYSPFGQDGSIRETHYPKAGEKNPDVLIGFADVRYGDIVWADFDEKEDQYFGTPFWSADSKRFYVPREPRIQNTLDLYAVNPQDGSKEHVYHETYPTWLDFPEGMLFGEKGLYMVRAFETGWQQIYFLSYDGKQLKRLTDGPNWRISLIRAEKDGTVYFTAERDSRVSSALYKVSPKGAITALTDPRMHVSGVSFSPDGRYFTATVSALDTPPQTWIRSTANASLSYLAADSKGPEYDAANFSLGQIVTIENEGFTLPGVLYLPFGFDPSKRYPVHVDIYGGPDIPQVYDRWTQPSRYQWYAENGIIELIADCRASGHNGREGLDHVYKQLTVPELRDFIAWAHWLQSLPYVIPEKIGVEGFSYGGTMTTLLVATAPDAFHYGISGGGVNDWMLYDTHYTERFMSTPEDNPEGYAHCGVLERAAQYPVRFDTAGRSAVEPVMLKLTHGTGDDNVHYQNTLQLLDVFHRNGCVFDFMVYPDGMHGYRGYQGTHFLQTNRAFWLKYLKEE